ncbi:hypothetical protein [Acinetobacter rudis]|uniref:Uncharacterized protein n=1 Tax=Acinetobacter rudis CIP 110305 TaxID=421052 RepID=S3P6X2_9GAMM|nr:hypothetical protein [Acinetobacter rudis]EPF74626.1 hypothetical protein F945_01393 [Acinetobacter rudis CIP 110305]
MKIKLFLCVVLASCATFAADNATKQAPIISEQSQLNLLVAPIKSLDDLNAYMRNTPKAKNPIEKLSTNGKARFLSSLRFNEKGLTSFGHLDLEAELSASEIYQILSLFGAQELISTTSNLVIKNDFDRMVVRNITPRNNGWSIRNHVCADLPTRGCKRFTGVTCNDLTCY